MSEHLPECDYEQQDYRGNDNRICYCDRLRACEQRVNETSFRSLLMKEDLRNGIRQGRTSQFKEMKIQVKEAARDGERIGYAAGVADMRAACIEAVEASLQHVRQPCACTACESANGAIAAMREVQP